MMVGIEVTFIQQYFQNNIIVLSKITYQIICMHSLSLDIKSYIIEESEICSLKRTISIHVSIFHFLISHLTSYLFSKTICNVK